MRITAWTLVAAVAVGALRSEAKPPSTKPKAAPPRETSSESKRGASVEKITGTPPISGLAIAAVAQGEAAWKLTVTNGTDGMLTLLWDESTFVAGDGKSWGRLVPSTTRLIDVEKPHAPAPLAPHATLDEVVVPESRIALSGFDYDWRKDLHGGRLYLAFQIGNEKKTWAATVTESDTESTGWWCWLSEIDGKRNGPKCSRTRDQCDRDRTPALRLAKLGLKVTDCAAHTGSAWCFIVRSQTGDRISPCWDGEERCNAMTTDLRGHDRGSIEVDCTERR